MIELRTQGAPTELHCSRSVLVDLLAASYTLVPAGKEFDRVDWDAVVAAWASSYDIAGEEG